VTHAANSGRRLTGLLSDILDLSRIGAGKLDIRDEAFSLPALLGEVAAMFDLTARQRGIVLAVRPDPDIPGELTGDAARLRQILFNLVGNAIKFTPKGEVVLEVSRLADPRPGYVRTLFCVSDTGIGIPAGHLDTIFEPFTQVDGSYSRRFQGAGLGLPIVKRLVGLLGGGLSIESVLDEGTTVYFNIPFRLGRDIPAQEAACPQTTALARRILVVEDDEVSRIVMLQSLTQAGYQAQGAASGEQALAVLGHGGLDAMLLDIQMPGKNGLEVAHAVRHDPRYAAVARMPIIAVTAHAMNGDRERFLAAGMNGYLAKPVELSSLLDSLDRVLGGQPGAPGVVSSGM
jgi:two-component system sensor histidine kinase EvgS